MSNIKIYTKTICPFCQQAKALFQDKNVDYEEINLDDKMEEFEKLKEETGLMTVPQIFIGDKLIGGFSELSSLNQEGKLDELLK